MSRIKKFVSLTLISVLILGTTIYGTYSYFSSKVNVNSNIKITVGNLKLQEEGSTNWEYAGVAEKGSYSKFDKSLVDQAQGKDNNFTIVKPGDVFTKNVTVKNTGSLNERITIKDVSSEAGNGFVEFSITDGLVQQAILKPGEAKTFIIKAQIRSSSSTGEIDPNEGK